MSHTPTDQDIAGLVEWFAAHMRAKLDTGKKKGYIGWSGSRLSFLYARLRGEERELGEALRRVVVVPCTGHRMDVIRECADVANLAAMIAQRMKMEEEKDQRPRVDSEGGPVVV